MNALRPGQDEGYGLLKSDYETIRLFIMGIIIKSLSSENMTQNMCQLFAYLPLIFPPKPRWKIIIFIIIIVIIIIIIIINFPPRHRWKIEQLQALQPILSDHSL